MDIFLKAGAVTLIAGVLCLIVSKRDKDIALLITVAGCCMLVILAVTYMEPVFTFFHQLEVLGNMDSDVLSILLKTVGIGLLCEICGLICTDVGNSALAKALQIVATALILWISLPLFRGLMELVGEILGEA